MPYPKFSADDAAWFETHPDRGYRCRHRTGAEKGADRAALSGPAYGLVIIRRCDAQTATLWSANPSLYVNGDDETLADWFGHYQDRAA
ncbi:hypothetical protein MKK69_20675 [Methylobacterium sp. J-026]|uniref:hypothetical protein n=1 Tax=Methylobacterium sp. J-026 TaxID=2836624 RepID=UPI001FB8A697|nr:hypothetical protein [Methylobacterium sp. J-026]MCJ2136436.1 hypothetical protein [Methylobacterium sp. J-026]